MLVLLALAVSLSFTGASYADPVRHQLLQAP
jgi:hypothetical protein